MGTRADFYVGKEWIGSVAWDGYEWSDKPDCPIVTAKTEDDFRLAVTTMFTPRDDVTLPEHGWPWPWKDSRTTDFAYVFNGDKVDTYIFGCLYTGEKDEDDYRKASDEEYDGFPDMTKIQKVTLGPRSGVIVVTGR
jgi:hypothetical protein